MRALALSGTFPLPLLLAALASFALIVSCVRDGAAVVAPVDVAVADVDAGVTSVSAAASSSAPRGRCTAKLEAEKISTAASCTLDERISQGPGVLHFPCAGTGAADATFGQDRFEGMMNDGSLVLDVMTELDVEDGCHWQSKQRIRGELHSGTFEWTYTEAPVRGQNCWVACRASAEINVEGPAGGAD